MDDFTPNNGAIRVVSGSLLDFQTVRKLIDDPFATHPEEISLCTLAGSVAVFNGSIWHSCTQNNSLQKRRALHCVFPLWHMDQQTDQKSYLKPETENRLSSLSRYILDVEDDKSRR